MQPHVARFVEFEIAPDFRDKLEEKRRTFVVAVALKTTGLADQVQGTVDLKALVEQGLSLRKQLNAAVQNHFDGQAGVLAEWTSATHITYPERKKKSPGPDNPT